MATMACEVIPPQLERHLERVPASLETLAKLPTQLRLFYRGRLVSELASRCLLNEALRCGGLRNGVKGANLNRPVQPLRGGRRRSY